MDSFQNGIFESNLLLLQDNWGFAFNSIFEKKKKDFWLTWVLWKLLG